MYQNYKYARNRVWETLIECNLNQLPINLAVVANFYNISIIKYSQSNDTFTGDGFSTIVDGRLIVYYNDTDYPISRQRFTLAHELGHCLLGHLKFGKTYNRNSEKDFDGMDIFEMQANVFARDLLMPAIVLHNLNIKSSEDIARICNVSMLSAEIRYKRLTELNERNMFNRHPLERQVYRQFNEYIKKALDTATI